MPVIIVPVGAGQPVDGLTGKDGLLGFHSARPDAKPEPTDAAPSLKVSEASPENAVPVLSGTVASPTDVTPSVKSAQASPSNELPSARSAQATPDDAVPLPRSAQATPADTVPSARGAQATPANQTPSQIGTAQDQPVSGIAGSDGVLAHHSAKPIAKQAPDDAVPSARATQSTPVDAAPLQKSAIASPIDAVPTVKSAQATPVNAIPSQKTAEPSPVNAVPVASNAVASPANALPSAKTAQASPSNSLPVVKAAQSTPSDAIPIQKTAQASPSFTAPSQLQTATDPIVTGLVGKDGLLGHHSARPQPKAESNVIPFTHPRICYQSILDAGTVTVSSGDVSAAKNKLTYDKWQPSGTLEWLAVDAGSDVDVDYLAIAAHNLSGRSIQFQYSDGDSVWTTVYSMAADSNKTILVLLSQTLSKRYWRALINGPSGMSIGVVMIGKALAVQRSINSGHSPITLSRTTVVRPAISERGQWLGRNVIRSGLSTSVGINNLYADWYRANFDPFVESARTEPFFFAWRPETYPEEVALCWTTDDIAPSIAKKDLMNVTFKVDAHA